MKLIVEEASSISKAIENGWHNAEQPREFSVKILETPEKNFFGMTTKKAKVAFMYNGQSEVTVAPKKRDGRNVSNHTSLKTVKVSAHSATAATASVPKAPKKKDTLFSSSEPVVRSESTPNDLNFVSNESDKNQETWSPEMIKGVEGFISKNLEFMGKADIRFICEPLGTRLKVSFSRPVFEDSAEEKTFFVSVAHLAVEMIRNQHKKHIRNMHIHFTSVR